MKIAVATFIYPGPAISEYARACLDTLARQTNGDFSLFVFNDGYRDVESVLQLHGPRAQIVEVCGTPADIRRQAIRYLRDSGFDVIVFADIDDLFDENRVAVAIEMIEDGVDIVLNELVLFGSGMLNTENLFQGRLEEKSVLKLEDIREGNCFGMSNTAVRVSVIPDSVFEPRNVLAFDWFFYTNLLIGGAVAQFTGKVATYYRQHLNNMAAIRGLSEVNILRGLEVKRSHFDVFDPVYAAEISETEGKIRQNKVFREAYCKAVSAAMLPQPFWWESIKTFRELGL
jgi:glycosyltransferase involved in cell wall biosynthesis